LDRLSACAAAERSLELADHGRTPLRALEPSGGRSPDRIESIRPFHTGDSLCVDGYDHAGFRYAAAREMPRSIPQTAPGRTS